VADAVIEAGKTSGVHSNPVVTLGFFLADKRRADHTVGSILVHLRGTVLGAWPPDKSVEDGATCPGTDDGMGCARAGETMTTCVMGVAVVIVWRHARWRTCTPALAGAAEGGVEICESWWI